MTTRRDTLRFAAAAGALSAANAVTVLPTAVGWSGQAHAQTGWPSGPIRIIVPFSAGGAADIAARAISVHLSNALGKPVVVENRAGADGAIAGVEVAKSAPDGHTIFMATASPLSYVPSIRANPPYDPIADFTPISNFGTFTFFLTVHESVPVKTLGEFLEYLRANPGKLSYGTGNTTSILAMAQMLQHSKTDMVHVPYKGEAQALLDFATGRIQVMWATPAILTAGVKEGKLRPLAVLLPKRSSLMPEVPTVAEAGLPLVNLSPWGGFVGPAKLPRDIVDRLSKEFTTILARPDLREQMDKYALIVAGSTPEVLTETIKEQLQAYGRTIKEAKIPLQ